MLGMFYNSFYLSNYEFSQRGDIPDEEEKEKKDGEEEEEEVDERIKRKKKPLDSFVVCHEQDLQNESEFKYQEACAKATEFSRNLVNTRGSEANPEWMETQTRQLIEESGCEHVKEVKVL